MSRIYALLLACYFLSPSAFAWKCPAAQKTVPEEMMCVRYLGSYPQSSLLLTHFRQGSGDGAGVKFCFFPDGYGDGGTLRAFPQRGGEMIADFTCRAQ